MHLCVYAHTISRCITVSHGDMSLSALFLITHFIDINIGKRKSRQAGLSGGVSTSATTQVPLSSEESPGSPGNWPTSLWVTYAPWVSRPAFNGQSTAEGGQNRLHGDRPPSVSHLSCRAIVASGVCRFESHPLRRTSRRSAASSQREGFEPSKEESTA
jgi:hypothetical protein